MKTDIVAGHGGTPLAVHRLGQGSPLVLLHGLFSNAEMNWVKFGHAAKLVAAGFECIMPDLRAHGQSAKPHEPDAYPPDVLALDLAAVIDQLGLTDYDLAGFSLGSRTSVRGVIGGLRPRRLVLGGMGLEGLAGWSGRQAFFHDVIARFGTVRPGDPAYMAQQFMKTMEVDREAAKLLLGSMADTPPAALAAITMPTLVLCGAADRDNGSPHKLVEALPNATLAEVPGTHMGSVTQPEMGEAIIEFLSGTAAR